MATPHQRFMRRRRWLIRISVLAGILLLIYLFRYPILRGMGNYLIREDPLSEADAVFVLSGNSHDRGKAGARLYHEGFAPNIVCTGGVKSRDLATFGIDLLHCYLTQAVLETEGVPVSDIHIIAEGTSTHEEKLAIIRYCRKMKWDKIIVVSSKFHTRRIHKSFRKDMAEAGIELVLRGAAESSFDENNWWNYEDGMIFLNNEYMKILYYALKY